MYKISDYDLPSNGMSDNTSYFFVTLSVPSEIRTRSFASDADAAGALCI
jgi:hypothetical protein